MARLDWRRLGVDWLIDFWCESGFCEKLGVEQRFDLWGELNGLFSMFRFERGGEAQP